MDQQADRTITNGWMMKKKQTGRINNRWMDGWNKTELYGQTDVS